MNKPRRLKKGEVYSEQPAEGQWFPVSSKFVTHCCNCGAAHKMELGNLVMTGRGKKSIKEPAFAMFLRIKMLRRGKVK